MNGGADFLRNTYADEALGQFVMLAVDSAIGSSVAVARNGEIFEVSSSNPMGHTEVIGGLLAEALDFAGVKAKDIEKVVAGVGPGPFTGLRIGIAAADAFALGVGAQVLPVVSHDAVAYMRLATSNAATQKLRVVQDAKRRELFVSEYDGFDSAGLPKRVSGPQIVTRETYVDSAADFWPAGVPAAGLLQVAARTILAGREFAARQPLYLRQPDVNLISASKA